ncbi:EAL and HDOD domain-containing protein [Oceanobacillus zhaokaii]|uniref:EAL and HDOD domain-containing protein n=1 Tax=Oceanobacillus zhaokaii TaxID=2052660 RepID=UPI0013B46323|nr:HDOD domain-containing protein [Oceanobacillus zhaokaii]
MEIYVARQPILNNNQEVCAYELLYRSNNQNEFSTIDGDYATSDVINSFMHIGIEELSEGKPCFINFTDTLLAHSVPEFFPPEMIVVEVLETVIPTEQIVESCRKLKEKGYKIALDDFIMRDGDKNFEKLIELADIIKVDIHNTPYKEQRIILNALKQYNVILLAEKVETMAEYEQCLIDGYTYFQGYFFSRPAVLSTNDVPVYNHNIVLILSELAQPEPNIDKITGIIETDISLSIKLLRLINSPMVGSIYEIKSIKQAIAYLGFNELNKWIFLLSLRERVNQRDMRLDEVMKMCFIRAKISELIALHKGKRAEASSYFLVGLLSLIDTLMKLPLDKLMNQLPLNNDIKKTILGKNTHYSDIFHLTVTMERADWRELNTLANKVDISKRKLFEIYKEALRWTNGIVNEA